MLVVDVVLDVVAVVGVLVSGGGLGKLKLNNGDDISLLPLPSAAFKF